MWKFCVNLSNLVQKYATVSVVNRWKAGKASTGRHVQRLNFSGTNYAKLKMYCEFLLRTGKTVHALYIDPYIIMFLYTEVMTREFILLLFFMKNSFRKTKPRQDDAYASPASFDPHID